MFLSVIILLAFYAAIPVALITGEYALFGIMGVWGLYAIWSCCASSTKYIFNTKHLPVVMNNIQSAINAAPVVRFTIQNYHYETRVVYERDSEGNSRTRTETYRVNTHYASMQMAIDHWFDCSPPVATLNYLDALHLTRLHTHKYIRYTPTGRLKYQS